MRKLKKEKVDKFLRQFGSVDSFSVFPTANNKIVPVNSGTFDKDLKNADFLKINDFLDLFLSHFGINNNFSNLKEELAKLGPFKESIDTISFFLFSNYIIKLSERVLKFNFSGFRRFSLIFQRFSAFSEIRKKLNSKKTKRIKKQLKIEFIVLNHDKSVFIGK